VIYIYATDDTAQELATAAETLFPGTKRTVIGPKAAQFLPYFDEAWQVDVYPNAEVIRPLLVKILPPASIVLLAHNTFGLDLGPGLSVKLGATYVPDVVGFDGLDGSTLKVVRQEYAGQVSAHVHCDIANGAVITIRSGAFAAAEASRSGQLVDRTADAADITARRTFVEVIAAESGDVDITKEEVLVSVGRGIGDKENLSLVEELSEAMGAAIACSRPIVDAKWLEKPRQVGTSGKTVKPRVYLALGISGSFQHLGGIKGSPFMIAVNKNPKAPIFQAATVGVVADLLEFLPVLTEKLKAR
jgi:electron transfer flavoprotein alpha subunit